MNTYFVCKITFLFHYESGFVIFLEGSPMNLCFKAMNPMFWFVGLFLETAHLFIWGASLLLILQV